MNNNELLTLLPIPEAKKSKRLGYSSLLFSFIYGLPGLILAIISLLKANKALRCYRQQPEIYDPSSLQDVMIARLSAMMGLLFSGLALFYFSTMIFLQGTFLPF